MSKWQVIVFDLDDTLYPERDFVYSGFRAVAAWAEKELGIPAKRGFTDLKGLFDEGTRGNIFDIWLKNLGINTKYLVNLMVQIYREHIPHITSYPGIPDLLQRLKVKFRLGLVTDGIADVQRRKLAALDLEKFFDALVFSDECGRDREAWKPSVKPFRIVLDKLRVRGSETIYIADNPHKDFFGARQVGMFTFRLRNPEGLYSFLEPPTPEYAAHVEIKDLNELETVILSIQTECKPYD